MCCLLKLETRLASQWNNLFKISISPTPSVSFALRFEKSFHSKMASIQLNTDRDNCVEPQAKRKMRKTTQFSLDTTQLANVFTLSFLWQQTSLDGFSFVAWEIYDKSVSIRCAVSLCWFSCDRWKFASLKRMPLCVCTVYAGARVLLCIRVDWS